MNDGTIYGAIEVGGTKMICALGDENGNILSRETIPTKTPDETLPPMIDFFRDTNIVSLGIACFGPIDLDRTSETYGYITSTPKKAWQYAPIVKAFSDALHIPIGFDTDVNGSLLGEITWGALKGLSDALYLTIGTGIGGGAMVGGQILHGMLHPEMGHVSVHPLPSDPFLSSKSHPTGNCPFHAFCFEGMAAGPAIETRWGARGETLTEKSEVWELESDYIAQALVNYIMTLSPKRIVLGGGVMENRALFPMIRKKVEEKLGGYLKTTELENLETYIVPAGLHGDQGLLGALKLAMNELENS